MQKQTTSSSSLPLFASLLAGSALLVLPLFAHAQTNLFGVYGTVTGIINGILVPLLFAVAFLTFLWGIFEYFIAGGANEEKRKQGKSFILYGLIGFFIMMSVWGLVNVVVNTFGLGSGENNGNQTAPTYPSL
jgi:Type IV secretion system pilin